MPTRVTLRTQSGKEYVKQVDHPLGHPRNPMPDHDVEEKLLRLATEQLGRARAKQVIELVWQLDRVKDISTLMPLLRVKHKG
jgi:2-methylcitrate dehydratase